LKRVLGVIQDFVSIDLVEDMVSSFSVHQLETFLEKRVELDEFSGAVLVAKDGKVSFKKAYGLANKRYNVPNQTDTKFNIGSINKIFTKVGILQLAERGKVSLNGHMGQYCPGFPQNVASKVAIHHLLNHTSGMGHYWNEKFETSKSRLRRVDDFLELFREEPLAFEPGEKSQYSNAGYVVLGKIIEVVSGQDYFDYVRERIYKPAGMDSTDHYEMDVPTPNLAIGYTRLDDEGQLQEGPRVENTFRIGVKGSPAGGGYSTVDDLHGFCIALHNHKLIGPEYTELALWHTSARREKAKSKVFGHAGGGPGIGSIFEMYLDLGYVSVILSNYDPDCMWPVQKQIRDIIIKQ
jgi:CubicO group peptidase (beta-lactamase class C family)